MYRRRRLNDAGDVPKWIRLRISHIVNRSIVNSFLIFPMRCINVGDWTMQAMYRSGFAFEYRYIVTSLRPSLICSIRCADADGLAFWTTCLFCIGHEQQKKRIRSINVITSHRLSFGSCVAQVRSKYLLGRNLTFLSCLQYLLRIPVLVLKIDVKVP